VCNADFAASPTTIAVSCIRPGGASGCAVSWREFRASLSAAGHVIDAAGIATVQKALRAEVRALRTGEPDRAARATFQTLRRNEQVVVNTLVARGVISAAGSPAAPGRPFLADCGKLMKIAMN
jgi:hypothetical protein